MGRGSAKQTVDFIRRHGPAEQPPLNGVATFSLPVQYTEKTGGDATGYLNLGSSLLAVRIDPEEIGRIRQGDTVSVAFPQGKVHVFDARSGRRL